MGSTMPGTMRLSVVFTTLMLLVTRAFAIGTPPPADPSVDSLVAFARLYGVVRFFHPADSVELINWDRFLVYGSEQMVNIRSTTQIASKLTELFDPIVVGVKIGPPGEPLVYQPSEGARVEWRHVGYGMEAEKTWPYASWRTNRGFTSGWETGRDRSNTVHKFPVSRVPLLPGLEAQVPLSLTEDAASTSFLRYAGVAKLFAQLRRVDRAGNEVTSAQACADVIQLWNIARHFYPNFDGATEQWDHVLAEMMAGLPNIQSRPELRNRLRKMTRILNDGHARIWDPLDTTPRKYLRFSVRPLGESWVVDTCSISDILPGDVIESIDGEPVGKRVGTDMELESGSDQYRKWRVARSLVVGRAGQIAHFRLRRGEALVDVSLPFSGDMPVKPARPPAIQEVRPKIFYIDLGRFEKQAFDKVRSSLEAADGIVFDLRGYPTRDARDILPYWLNQSDTSRWMQTPRFIRPFGEEVSFSGEGWAIVGNPALQKPRKVLIVDGRAVSYSESIVGYFVAHHVGHLIGEATAGANGNIVTASLPSGLMFTFTGMRVFAPDGRHFHGIGFSPDELVIPTLEGIRAGRDEVLERAIMRTEEPTRVKN
jgi:C-terminal processing protease CtpA/Prc